MALKIVIPPKWDMVPVGLAEAKEQLRIDDRDSDGTVFRLIRAVTDWLAGRNGWLGRSIMKQTLELTVPLPVLDGFTGPRFVPAGLGYGRDEPTGIVLPRPPVIAVGKVEILDGASDPVAIAAGSYSTFEGDDGLTRLTFAADYRWPVIAHGSAFVRVTYDAGYGETSADVDEGLRHAILMAVTRLYESRGAIQNSGLQDDPMIATLFANYRVY